jgi:translation initiation factor IF-2
MYMLCICYVYARVTHARVHTHAQHSQVPIMVRADVDGALEAIVASLMALPRQEIALKIISAAVGQVMCVCVCVCVCV